MGAAPHRLTLVLDVLSKSNLPAILVACKCDQHPAHREVDPAVVEHKAKQFLPDVQAFQTSQSAPDTQKGCLSVITRAVIASKRREYAFASTCIAPKPYPRVMMMLHHLDGSLFVCLFVDLCSSISSVCGS